MFHPVAEARDYLWTQACEESTKGHGIGGREFRGDDAQWIVSSSGLLAGWLVHGGRETLYPGQTLADPKVDRQPCLGGSGPVCCWMVCRDPLAAIIRQEAGRRAQINVGQPVFGEVASGPSECSSQ